MSLEKDKASLFATGTQKSGSARKAAPKPSPAAAPPPPVAPAIIKTRGGAIPALSAEAKARKMVEAKDCSEKGTKSLQTSIFQWSPDYVLAAPYFERAGECYKIAGEFKLSRLMYMQAADANEKMGSNSACALTLLKAANISQMDGDSAGAADIFKQAAQQWMLQGDARKAADAYDNAAAELENVSEDGAAVAYDRACELVFPQETPESQVSKVSANAVEIFRHAIRFHLSHRRFKELIPLLDRLTVLLQAFDLQSGMCKMMLSVTLVQLHMGDVVGADKTFLQTHLNNSVYLNSNECAVAENFLNSFKNYDIEELDKARGPTSVMYVDPDFQEFARALTFMSAAHTVGEVPRSAAPAEPPQADTAELHTALENISIAAGAATQEMEGIQGEEEAEPPVADAEPEEYGAYDDEDEIDLC